MGSYTYHVRFTDIEGDEYEASHTHPLPAKFRASSAQDSRDLMVSTVKKHWPELTRVLKQRGWKCTICGAVATQPRIEDLAGPVCDRADCSAAFQAMMKDIVTHNMPGAKDATSNPPSAALSKCAACGKAGQGLLRCTKCKAVAYCSKDCQKADAKKHNKICAQLLKARASYAAHNEL